MYIYIYIHIQLTSSLLDQPRLLRRGVIAELLVGGELHLGAYIYQLIIMFYHYY